MNQMARPPLPNMTADEFLSWPEDQSGRKFHLIDGEVWATSPANRMHGDIQANLAYLLTGAARRSAPHLRTTTGGAIIPALNALDNVRAYATLASVQEIVVVHTSRMEVEVSRRDPAGRWPSGPAILKAGDRLGLASIQFDCAIADVYADTMLTLPARD